MTNRRSDRCERFRRFHHRVVKAVKPGTDCHQHVSDEFTTFTTFTTYPLKDMA